MKVKQLIELLQGIDLEMEVVTEFEGGYSSCDSVRVYEFEDGESVIIS